MSPSAPAADVRSSPTSVPALWRGALAAFVLAGVTGVGYRLAVFLGWGGLMPAHVRHAHSHLMLFSWVTPVLFALIGAHLPRQTGRSESRVMRGATWAALAVGFASYVPFLLWGYSAAPIAGRRLPLAVIVSTLGIVVWYAFTAAYVRTTRGAPRTHAVRLWDAALVMLSLSSLGAWTLGALQMRGGMTEFALAAALHLFLNLFAEGWIVLALLGVLHALHPAADTRASRWGTPLAAYALPLTFLLGVPVSLVPPDLRLVSGVAGLVAATGVALHVAPLARAGAPRAVLGFLGLRLAMQVGVAIGPVARWGEGMGLRVLFLHVLLLGVVSLGLVAAARATWGPAATRGHRAFTVAVAALVASLVPISGLWPTALAGAWTWRFVAAAAMGPALVAGWMLVRTVGARR